MAHVHRDRVKLTFLIHVISRARAEPNTLVVGAMDNEVQEALSSRPLAPFGVLIQK
jgi:hypothetical protein